MPVQPQKTVYTYYDFMGMTLASLKDFLSLRGLNQGGRKAEIVARAFGAYELGAPIKYTQEQISEALKKEYSNRLEKHGITDPKLIPDQQWIDDVTKWPQLDDGKVFSYILNVKAVETDYIGVYKDQKAYSYWVSGFVGTTILYSVCPSDKNISFLKSEVRPSQRINEDPHKVWVCVKKTATNVSIATSWCSCTAGSAEACNHVIAVLYKVNYAYHQSFISPACTSIPQGWNRGTRKEVKPSKVSNITFRKDKKTKKERSAYDSVDTTRLQDFDPRHKTQQVLTDERVSSLLHGIKEVCPRACILTSVCLEKDNSLPRPLPELAEDFTVCLLLLRRINLLKKLAQRS